MIELTLRIIFSLGIVLLLMWALARVARRPLAGRSGGTLGVVARQALTRGASVQVVRIGDRALVLGVTDQQVTLLTETDPATLEPAGRGEVREPVPLADLALDGAPLPTAADRDRPGAPTGPAGGLAGSAGGLAGSALSPSTWRQAASALRKARRP